MSSKYFDLWAYFTYLFIRRSHKNFSGQKRPQVEEQQEALD